MEKKQFLSVMLVIVLLTYSCSSKKVREEKFSNGNPKLKFEIEEKKDGSFLKDGYYKEWFENGQIEVSGHYDDNNETGEWTTYYETGKIEEIGNFKKGKKEGKWKRYEENGQIRKEENYLADQLDGVQKRWYQDGQKEEEATFTKGKLNGKSTTWNKDGSIKTVYTFEFGNNITLVGTWRNNINKTFEFFKDGTYNMLDSTGKNISTGNYNISGDRWDFGGAMNDILYMTDKEYRVMWPSDSTVYIGKRIK